MSSIFNILRTPLMKMGSVTEPSAAVPELMQILSKLNQQSPELAYGILDKCGVGIASTVDDCGRSLLHHMCILQAQQRRSIDELVPVATIFNICMYSDEEGKCYDESGKLITTNDDDYVFACVSWLISKGADPNALDSLGNTPLIDAIQYINDPSDCYKMCVLLLQSNADPNRVGRFALPPLLTATTLNKPSIVRLLLVYGANPNFETANKTRLFIKLKESALSYASRNGLYEIVEILLKSKGYKLSMLFKAILEADPRAKEMIATFLEFTPTTPKPSPTTVI